MRIRKSKRQSCWEFMRRNREFEVGDAMMITQMGAANMRRFLTQLVRRGTCKCLSKGNVAFTKKRFFVLDTQEVVCPVGSKT